MPLTMQTERFPERIWEEALPLILKSPIALFSLFVTFLRGYGISYLLFDFRRESALEISNWLHLSVGGGYAALIFLIVNWRIVYNCPTLDDLAKYAPQTMVVGFAFLFILFCIVTIIRENQWRS